MTTTTANSKTLNGVTLHASATVSGGSVVVTPTLSSVKPIWDESNSISWSGAVSGSFAGPAIRIGSSSAGRTASHAALKVNAAGATSISFSVAQTTSPQAKSLTVNLIGINYAGATLTVTVPFTIPPLPPGTPSGGSASAPYLSSGQWRTNLSWSNAAGATGVRLWRWDATRAEGNYQLIATLGAVSGHTDTLALDQRYKWAVSNTNAGGEGPRRYFGAVYTKPHTPTGLSAARSGTSVVGSFVNQSRLNPAFELQDSTDDGATWATVQTIARANFAVGAKVTFSLSMLDPALPHRIRVRAVGEHPSPGGTAGDWSAPSGTVIIITRPSAPTGLTSGVAAAGGALTLSASPASTVLPDGSSLSAFEWRHRAQGASAWTTVPNSAPTGLSTSVPGYASGTRVEHQVRVKGAHADWSDWSAVASVLLSAVPLSSFSSPASGSTLAGDTLTVEASGYDPDGGGITTARWGLEDVSGRVLAAPVESTTHLDQWTYPVKLDDGQQVVAWVQHRERDGLWSERATVSVSVQYVGPPELAIDTRWDVDNAMVMFEWEPTVDASRPDVATVDLFVLADGLRVEVASGLPAAGAWPMRLAPLVDTTYMVAVRSELPSTTWQTVHVAADPALLGRFVVNGGLGYGVVAMAAYDITFERSGGRARSVEGGWANSPFGRETIRESLADERKVTCSALDSINAGGDFVAVQASPHPLWYRDPTGASWPCSMTPPVRSMSHPTKVELSFDVQRIGGGPTLVEAADALTTADTVYADLIPGS